MDASFDPWDPESQKHILPPATVTSVLITQPWSVYQKQIAPNSLVSHTGQNSDSIVDWNNSRLGCLHLALLYKYYFCMEETYKHVSMHLQ